MGRKNRRKNKRNVDNTAAGAEEHYRPRLGTGSGSGTPADSGDDPQSYIEPSRRNNRRRRGSGKLRVRDQKDDATNKTGAEVAAELSSKSSDETTPQSTTPDTHTGVSGGSLEQETNPSGHHQPAIVDRQKEQQQQRQQVQHGSPGDEKDKEATSEIEEEQAVRLSAKESNGTGDGSCDDDATTCGHPAASRTSPAKTTTASVGRGAVVPALPLGSSNANVDRDEKEAGGCASTVVQADRKLYSLAWAGGRKGRPLMKSVGDVLSDWLCTQEAKVRNIDWSPKCKRKGHTGGRDNSS